MTADDWKHVEKELQSLFSSVKLRCDGYQVTLRLQRVSQFRNAISVYVDGWFKGEWLNGDSEERRRFFPLKQRYFFSKKFRDKNKNRMSKRINKDLGLDPDKKYSYRQSHWGSFRSLKAHFIKNNKEIELVREERDGENNQ